jgi:hypothetical protein
VNDPEKSKNSKKNFERDGKKYDRLLLSLEVACQGLAFISETDSDLEPFLAGEVASRSPASYLEALQIDNEPVEEVPFDDFFARLTTERDWHRELDKKRVLQFSKLRKMLENHLDDLRVIRVGRIKIDIYIVGVDSNGRLAGVKTKAIET